MFREDGRRRLIYFAISSHGCFSFDFLGQEAVAEAAAAAAAAPKKKEKEGSKNHLKGCGNNEIIACENNKEGKRREEREGKTFAQPEIMEDTTRSDIDQHRDVLNCRLLVQRFPTFFNLCASAYRTAHLAHHFGTRKKIMLEHFGTYYRSGCCPKGWGNTTN